MKKVVSISVMVFLFTTIAFGQKQVKPFSQPLEQKANSGYIGFGYSSEGLMATYIQYFNRQNLPCFVGIEFTKKAPIGLTVGLRPVSFWKHLDLTTGLECQYRGKFNISDWHSTMQTFKDAEWILASAKFGLSLCYWRWEMGIYYNIGQRIPVYKGSGSYAWQQDLSIHTGIHF